MLCSYSGQWSHRESHNSEESPSIPQKTLKYFLMFLHAFDMSYTYLSTKSQFLLLRTISFSLIKILNIINWLVVEMIINKY